MHGASHIWRRYPIIRIYERVRAQSALMESLIGHSLSRLSCFSPNNKRSKLISDILAKANTPGVTNMSSSWVGEKHKRRARSRKRRQCCGDPYGLWCGGIQIKAASKRHPHPHVDFGVFARSFLFGRAIEKANTNLSFLLPVASRHSFERIERSFFHTYRASGSSHGTLSIAIGSLDKCCMS